MCSSPPVMEQRFDFDKKITYSRVAYVIQLQRHMANKLFEMFSNWIRISFYIKAARIPNEK